MSLFSNLSISIAYNSANIAARQGKKALSGLLMKGIYGVEPGRVRFHYYSGGGNLLKILVNSALQRVGAELKNEAQKRIKQATKDLIYGKKKKFINNSLQKKKQDLFNKSTTNAQTQYGHIKTDDGHLVSSKDMYNNECYESIMLAIPSKKPITYNSIVNKTIVTDEESHTEKSLTSKKSNYLVWYDCTALVSVSSDKNLILTKVSGRDYSRKELVSNGDISFQVSGHILSKTPELYPTEEVKKFIEIMRYKGIVRVNNIIFDQFNVDKIVIKDFSLSPVEGSLSRQDYSFSAVCIQPDSEVEVTEDTLYIDEVITKTQSKKETKWSKFLKSKAEGAVYDLTDIADTVVSSGINDLKI